MATASLLSSRAIVVLILIRAPSTRPLPITVLIPVVATVLTALVIAGRLMVMILIVHLISLLQVSRRHDADRLIQVLRFVIALIKAF